MEKKFKFITILKLTPQSLHMSLKKRKYIISLSIAAFLSFYMVNGRDILIYDDKHSLLSFTAFYKELNARIDVIGEKESVKRIGNFKITYLNRNNLFIDNCNGNIEVESKENKYTMIYDTLILWDNFNYGRDKKLFDLVKDQLVINIRNREIAQKCFKNLSEDESFVNVRMCDFF